MRERERKWLCAVHSPAPARGGGKKQTGGPLHLRLPSDAQRKKILYDVLALSSPIAIDDANFHAMSIKPLATQVLALVPNHCKMFMLIL